MNKTIAALITSESAQSFQQRMMYLVMTWYFINIVDSPAVLGTLLAFTYAPAIIVPMLAGMAVDRFNKAALGLSATVWDFFAVFGLFILFLLEVPASGIGFWLYVIMLVFMGITGGILDPLERTLIPTLVEPKKLKEVNSLLSALKNLAGLFGPVVAGALLALSGYHVAFIAVLVVALIPICCYLFLVLRVRLPRTKVESRGVVGSFKKTFSHFRTERWLLIAAATAMFTNMAFVMMTAVTLPYLYADLKINGAAALGTCMMVLGIGNLLGTALTYRWKRLNLDRAMVLFFASMFVMVAAGFFIEPVIVGITLFGIMGFLSSPMTIIYMTELQQAIPKHMLGSAMGMLGSAAMMAQPLGPLLAGVLLLTFHGSIVMTFAATISLTAAVIGWVFLKREQARKRQQEVVSEQA
ncbi:MFS transporter [Bacillus sp. FSL W7-1360]